MSYERKYLAPARTAPLLRVRLERALAADAVHAEDVVHSVYFDSPDARAVGEVADGDRTKQKVRIRWYDSSGAAAVFLEVKSKQGSRRDKLRLALPGFDLSLPLTHPDWCAALAPLRARGALPRGLLQPSLHVCYRRSRFVARADDLRVAFDRDIRAIDAHPRFATCFARARRPLDHVVVEVKGAQRELPRALWFLHRAGLRRGAFSKYGLLASAHEAA